MGTLHFEAYRSHIDALVQAVLEAADPAQALATFWRSVDQNLASYEHCWVVGAGKASLEMGYQLHKLLEDDLTGGVIAVMPERLAQMASDVLGALPFQMLPAAHPLPDERNLAAAQAIANVARQAGMDDLLLCLISGGGSAHLTLPVEGLALSDLRLITDALLRAGAPIQDLNAVRKHCEQLKGGGLARMSAPADVHAFILSDVMGDPLDVIASGPTAPDPTTYQDALAVLAQYDVRNAAPAITAHLEACVRQTQPETLKPGDLLFDRVTNTIIGSNQLALQAAEANASHQGWHIMAGKTGVEGEAREIGARLGEIAHHLRTTGPSEPRCAILGGETTVTVQGTGRGGRNQEMALAAALAIEGLAGVAIATFATDGIDGPTDAAGAHVTGETCDRARAAGLNPQAFLANNDSYTFFEQLGNLIITGPTGTNVNDLAFVLVYPQ